MTEPGTWEDLRKWYWALSALFGGVLLVWFVANAGPDVTTLLFFTSPVYLVLLSAAIALRQAQLTSSARGPVIWLAMSVVSFCATSVSQPLPIVFMAFAMLYVSISVAGLWWVVGALLKDASKNATDP
jgi:hypothetical protein